MCHKSQDEAHLLLCDGCNRGYHMYCLTPALTSIPKTDWFCFQCLTAVGKDYGFEDGPEYTLAEFQEFSNKFKSEWFSKNEGPVTEEECENEFWRLANNPLETCEVEYGADLHSTHHGSGFMHPEHNYRQAPFDPWNLNVLPVAPQSLFTHINTDISGMMVPWLYIGMCFSAFCWHNEDHYTYSINYMHWGETKTWYGIPGSNTSKFEATMKKAMPELFDQHPDLLFQLVTMFSPERLLKEDVDVYAVDQRPGQFVVTFPKAYHSGFNHGFNFCEAVNFAPLKWLDHGLECAKLYKEYRRQPCFSHDALLVTAALNLKSCYQTDLDWLKRGMIDMQKRELAERVLVRTRHLKETVLKEPREEMQCDHCHCYTYLSYIGCVCTDKVSCSEHTSQLCVCPTSSKTLFVRYTDAQLQDLVDEIVGSGDAREAWTQKLSQIMSNPTLSRLRALVKEGEEVGIPRESLISLQSFIQVTDHWIKEAERVLSLRLESNKSMAKSRMERIQCLLDEKRFISYPLPHIARLEEYHRQLASYDQIITPELLMSGNKQAQEIAYSEGEKIRADSVKFNRLKTTINAYAWTEEVQKVLYRPYNAKVFRRLIKTAEDFGIHDGPWLERLTTIEHEAKRALQFIDNLCRGRQKVELGQEHEVFLIGKNLQNPNMSFTLDPNLVSRFQNAINRSEATLSQVQDLFNRSTRPDVLQRPTYDEGQKLMTACKEIIFTSDGVRRLSQELGTMNTWTDAVRNTFMHGRHRSLEIVLQNVLANVESITTSTENPHVYCICRKAEQGLMVACDRCKEWYHDACVKLPRSVARSSSISYICPVCSGGEDQKTVAHSSQRPSLADVQHLMHIAQHMSFLPRNYATIENIRNRMKAFESRLQLFLSRNQDKSVIQKYIRCLEGLEIQLPQQMQALKAKLRSPYHEAPHHKLSISSLLHPTEPTYPILYNTNQQYNGISVKKRPFIEEQTHPRIQKLRLTVKTPPRQ